MYIRPQVMFTGHRNINSKGFIAIDDITMKEGACSDQSMYSETHHHPMFRGIQNMQDIFTTLAFFFFSFQVCVGLIPAYVALLMVPVTWVAGFVKEPQKMRWITPPGLKMVSRNLLLYRPASWREYFKSAEQIMTRWVTIWIWGIARWFLLRFLNLFYEIWDSITSSGLNLWKENDSFDDLLDWKPAV